MGNTAVARYAASMLAHLTVQPIDWKVGCLAMALLLVL